MPNGRPPKPTEQKRKLGNPGKRGLPASSSLAVVPSVDAEPIELDPVDALEFVLGQGKVWLAATDTLALSMLRESLEERSVIRELVLTTHSTEARKALRELDKQVIGQLATLGFDPAARSRLGLAEVKAASKLQDIRARQAQK